MNNRLSTLELHRQLTKKEERAYEHALKTYADVFVTVREKDKVHSIKCSGTREEQNRVITWWCWGGANALAYVTLNSTVRRDNQRLKRFLAQDVLCWVAQQTSDGIIIVFEEQDFETLLPVIKPIRRRGVSLQRAKKWLRNGFHNDRRDITTTSTHDKEQEELAI